MGRIPDDILERIQDSCDIVELIASHIPLKKAGANFKAPCPFHKEKTPSFMVSPAKQIYHCFGCGQGGNAINFLMQYERLTFREAAEQLAKKAGISLPESEPMASSEKVSFTQNLYGLNELACRYYQDNLIKNNAASAAKNYLDKRGIGAEVISKFKLGVALDSWDGFLNLAKSKGFNLGLLEKSGMVAQKEKNIYDRFRKRLIFPIFDIKGRAIAFGARCLDESLPKYINSPESPIYVKGQHLYGMNFSKDYIRSKDFCIIVEGYLDFITPFQAGVRNIVASLGTALTVDQIKLIRRFTNKVIILYDADKAGELATLRGLDLLIEEGLEVKVVQLPPAEDPDSVIKKKGKEEFLKLLSQSKSMFDYKLEILRSRYNIKIPERKADLVREMLSTIKKFKSAVVKSSYIKRLSEAVDVDEDSLLAEMRMIKDYSRAEQFEEPKPAILDIPAVEKMILQLVLEQEKLMSELVSKIDTGYFQDPRIKKIFSVMFDLSKQGKSVAANRLINHFEDASLVKIISEASSSSAETNLGERNLLDECLCRLKQEKQRSELKSLQDRIKAAHSQQDEVELNSLVKDYNNLIRLKKGNR